MRMNQNDYYSIRNGFMIAFCYMKEKPPYMNPPTQRVLWDALWFCVDQGIIKRDFINALYKSGLNDSHIETALKKAYSETAGGGVNDKVVDVRVTIRFVGRMEGAIGTHDDHVVRKTIRLKAPFTYNEAMAEAGRSLYHKGVDHPAYQDIRVRSVAFN